MILLANGCSCSTPAVFPKNWKTQKASLKVTLYIKYRFYDPLFKDDPKIKGAKQVVIKSMNKFQTREERRKTTQDLYDSEMDLLKNQGYNPITGAYIDREEIIYEIDPGTPFIKALPAAHLKLDKAKSTLSDISSVINGVEKAATQLRLTSLPISQVTRKHFKIIFDQCKKIIPGWSAKRFNKYRAYLKIVFSELIELEATEVDPFIKIKKQKVIRGLRVFPTMEERTRINNHLKNGYYTFWRFMQIFFHSAARESELMLLKKENVDLANQCYRMVVKKGQESVEMIRTIKDTALPLWIEAVAEAKNGQYLFTKGLKPGYVAINPIQISRRWRVHVKTKLGINVDFYTLKHINLDETAAALTKEDAAKMAGHTTTVITMEHYLQGEKERERERQHERLKGVGNKFA